MQESSAGLTRCARSARRGSACMLSFSVTKSCWCSQQQISDALVPPDGEHLLEKKTPMPKDRRLQENGAGWGGKGGEGKEGDLPQGKISGEGWLVIRERWGGKGRRPTVGEDGAGREKMPQGWKGGGRERRKGKGEGWERWGRKVGWEKSDTRKYKIGMGRLLVWNGKDRATSPRRSGLTPGIYNKKYTSPRNERSE